MVVEANFGFGKVEVERTGFEPAPPNALGEFMGRMEHPLDGIRGLLTLENLEDFRVTEAALGMNDCGVKFRAEHLAVVGQQKLDAFGQAIDIRLERAKFV